MFATNKTVATVARGSSIDKYGRKTTSDVYTSFRAWLDDSVTFNRDSQGDRGPVSATLIVDAYYSLKSGDIITLDNDDSDKYLVKDITEHPNIAGTALCRTYTLMRQR